MSNKLTIFSAGVLLGVFFAISVQALSFLTNDARWDNLRIYYIEQYGQPLVTFVFGLVISFICPLLFGMQNVLLAVILNYGKLNKATLWQIIKTLDKQLIVIYDLSLLNTTSGGNQNGFLQLLKLATGYFLYVLPRIRTVDHQLFSNY